MAVNRDYVLNKIKGRMISPFEFDFDRLVGPPLYSLLSTDDIMRLNNIATSIRYSANVTKKLSAIDDILRKRGFVKYTGGTNRVVYRFLEDESFILKIATNAIAIGDSPREFINQNIYKPFVTKVFEVSPCGTVGLFERVTPITSREEFISVADDVYYLISNWFTGQYIMDDIGTNYFLNYGLRNNFGPVLLDFPYSYKLDGEKLYCNAPSDNDTRERCGGVIDYDDGYNHLRCTKCGLVYRAKELEKAVENNKVMISKGGKYNMVIKITSGEGVRRIETNPERYLDVSPKLVARGNKKSSVKIGVPKVKVTGLKPPKPDNEEVIKTKRGNTSSDDEGFSFITCSGIVSNTDDLFGAEPSAKCILIKIGDDGLKIGNDYVIIDRINDKEIKDISIITNEALNQLTDEIDYRNDTNSLLAEDVTRLKRELLEKEEYIADLKDELNNLNTQIEDLEYKTTSYDDLVTKLSNERSDHNKTKSELSAMEILVKELQNTVDDLTAQLYNSNASCVETATSGYISTYPIINETASFDVSSPMFSQEIEHEDPIQEPIDELRNDIEDKSIAEVIDKILPDNEGDLFNNEDHLNDSVLTTEQEHYSSYSEEIPVIDNAEIVESEVGDSTSDKVEENIDTDIIIDSNLDDENSIVKENESGDHAINKIVIPDVVQQQIKGASEIISGNTKSNDYSNNAKNYKWDAKRNKKKHKKR